jgi:hypothetical protein
MLVLVGLVVVVIGAYLVFHQKVYYDPKGKSVTAIEIPWFGKFKTNVPALALCIGSLAIIWLGHNEMKDRGAKLVEFKGEVAIDPDGLKGINAITVGVTSGLWTPTSTPTAPIMDVSILVPNSWPSYTAFAFALGGARTRPAIIGTSLGNPQFKLSIQP